MKYIFTFVFACLSALSLSAQKQDCFNHMTVGLNVGSTGIGVDLATPICDYVDVRAGVTVVPGIYYKKDINLGASANYNTNMQPFLDNKYGKSVKTIFNVPEQVDMKGQSAMVNGSFLFDIYPFPTCKFRATVGLFVGSSHVVDINNSQAGSLINAYNANQQIALYNDPANAKYRVSGVDQMKYFGININDGFLTPDENGNIDGYIKTNVVRPYVGVGYGRSVLKDKKIDFNVDAGVLLWGSPKVYSHGKEIKAIDNSQSGKMLKAIGDLKAYPVITVRLCGNIF